NGDDPEEGVRLLHRAYSLGAPKTHIDFYRDFAELYDSTFAASLGYIYPLGIASVLSGQQPPQGAILAIGCGTGLVATAIRKVDPIAVIDGVDISPDMLGKARAKGEYRDLVAADLTADCSHIAADYAAIVSAGTFTFGHLGPELIPDMVGLCRRGAVAALGFNSVYYVDQGFRDVLDSLETEGRIANVSLHEMPIYDGRDEAHQDDTAMILAFTTI
ncbi:MAG: methyltransferase domain-containing protein, partial [SAR116 cluster bacterium]|nr:methyltransferase domain-containing protein [SAR116 cluster bacterium]